MFDFSVKIVEPRTQAQADRIVAHNQHLKDMAAEAVVRLRGKVQDAYYNSSGEMLDYLAQRLQKAEWAEGYLQSILAQSRVGLFYDVSIARTETN